MPDTDQTGDSSDVGRRYRFEHLALPLVMRDMYFSKDDPGPGDLSKPVLSLGPWDGDRNNGPGAGDGHFQWSHCADDAQSLPYIQPVGTSLMVLAGMRLVSYWLTAGVPLF